MRAGWLVPVAIFTVAGAAVLDRDSGIGAWLQLRKDLNASHARIEVLAQEIRALRSEVALLETDEFKVEQAIREELELARPGEVVVRFDDGRSGI